MYQEFVAREREVAVRNALARRGKSAVRPGPVARQMPNVANAHEEKQQLKNGGSDARSTKLSPALLQGRWRVKTQSNRRLLRERTSSSAQFAEKDGEEAAMLGVQPESVRPGNIQYSTPPPPP